MMSYPSDNPTLSLGRSRREFLRAGIGAAAVTALSPFLSAARLQAATTTSGTSDLDAEAYIRPYGKCVCLPPQEWAASGDWVMQKTLELLQPDRWHSWGDWPDSSYPGRIPMIFATRYFNQDRVAQRMMANSGEVWMGPNEPEMPNQCFESPEAIADLTCTLIDIGQRVNTEWQWGSPAVTLSTEHNGLAWLTEWVKIMRRKRGISMPFTWFIHPYTCNSVQKLEDSMGAWWEWYAVWGGGKTPVVINEVCAEDAPEEVQGDVMRRCFEMWKDGDVQGVFWFATYRSGVEEQKRQKRIPWQHYALTTLDHSNQTVSLTDLGQYWKNLK